MICIARTFGAPDSVPAGSTERSASIAAHLRPQLAADARDDVDHVRVGLDGHERLDLDGAVLADAPEVVAAEVDEHHVLGALLLVRQQVGGDRDVGVGVGPARPRAGDRAGRGAAAGDGDERLGRGADDLEVLEVEEVHVGRRVDRPQAAVDRERLDRARRRPALARHDLEGVAGVHVLDDAGHHRLERLARHVGLELRLGALRVRLGARQRAGQALAHLGDPLAGARLATASARGLVTASLGLVAVGVGEDRDRVLEVVERDQHVGEHQRHVRQAEHVGVGLGQRLDRADAVVAEEPDRAAGERRAVGERRLAVLGDLGGGDGVGVAAVGEAPAHDLARLDADERVAARRAGPARPTRAGMTGPEPRSFRNAETGVSVSAMKVSVTGMTL